MKTYIVTPSNGEPAYEVEASVYEFDPISGRHIFKGESGPMNNGQIVANLINVSVRVKPESQPDS